MIGPDDLSSVDSFDSHDDVAANTCVVKRRAKRKTRSPTQSLAPSLLPEERAKLKIFQLDVFSELGKRTRFSLIPSRQSLTRKKRERERQVSNSRSRSSSMSTAVNIQQLEAAPSIEKSLPSDLVKNTQPLDLSRFKDTQGCVPIMWKGHPLVIDPASPRFDELTPEELETCRTMRILPEHYFYIKDILLRAAIRGPAFKKRDAQSWFRIDVNKVPPHQSSINQGTIDGDDYQINKLYDWFMMIGWIPSTVEGWNRHIKEHVLTRLS